MASSTELTPRRREIASAAAALFEEQGFHNTSMVDIAEAIGVAKPTLYHYVKSKSEIVAWIHDECVLQLLPPLEAYLTDGHAPDEVLRRVARDILTLLASKPGYLRVYFEHHRELPPREQIRSRRQRDEYAELVQRVVENGVEQGIFDAPDPRMMTLAFFGMCNWAYQWFTPGGALRPDEVAARLSTTFLDGLRTRDSLLPPR